GFSISGNSGVPFSANDQQTMTQIIQTAQSQYGFNAGSLDEFSRPTNNNKVFVRGDVNVNTKNRVTGRVNYVDGLQYVGTPTTTSYLLPSRFYNIQDKTLSSVGQLDTTLSSRMYNQFRVTYQRERNNRGTQPGFKDFPQVQVDLPSGNNIVFGTELSSQANKLNQDIVEINDDLTLVKGNHTLSLGTHNELFHFFNLFIQNFDGSYRFTSLANFQAGLAQSFSHNFSNDASQPQLPAEFSVQQY